MRRRPGGSDGSDGSDEAAERVGRLYDRRAVRLYRYAVMILADREAAADAVHVEQTFVISLPACIIGWSIDSP